MLKVDPSEIKFTYSRSSGAGGQNVNKVNTQATLHWDMENSKSVSTYLKNRFRTLFKRFVNEHGEVVIQSQRHRSQSRNKLDCETKLRSMLLAAKAEPKKRRATKPTRSSVKKRLDNKKRHSDKKKNRSEKF
ncbi:MAG: aminoacyl-tRNA hydrolase [Bacteriovoracaceae bacterium]|nr:aminoacyl-tRNA hydrolase [Bacteriovoracaceae bacterium]